MAISHPGFFLQTSLYLSEKNFSQSHCLVPFGNTFNQLEYVRSRSKYFLKKKKHTKCVINLE